MVPRAPQRPNTNNFQTNGQNNLRSEYQSHRKPIYSSLFLCPEFFVSAADLAGAGVKC